MIGSVNADGVGRGSCVGHHQGDAFLVAAIDNRLGFQVPLQFRALVIEQVIVECAPAHEFAGAGCLEPLGGSFAGLQLGHCSAWSGTNDNNTSQLDRF